MATILALESIPEPSLITVYSNSLYLISQGNEVWSVSTNLALWKKLINLLQVHQATFVHIPKAQAHPPDRAGSPAGPGKDNPTHHPNRPPPRDPVQNPEFGGESKPPSQGTKQGKGRPAAGGPPENRPAQHPAWPPRREPPTPERPGNRPHMASHAWRSSP